MKDRSARGVYYNLEKSPYEYEDDYGNIFKFSSEKKLEMFIKRLALTLKRVDKEIDNLESLKCTGDFQVTYEKLKKDLPKIVYNDMIYK